MTDRLRLLRRSVLAGFIGTSAMTASYGVEHLLRRHTTSGPLDYDDGPVPAQVAARILRISHPGPVTERALGLLVHMGYGSVLGIVPVPLVRRVGPLRATLAWWAAVTLMAGALFPLLGGTPPPWRWRRDVLLTCLLQHLVYASVVVGTIAELAPDASTG